MTAYFIGHPSRIRAGNRQRKPMKTSQFGLAIALFAGAGIALTACGGGGGGSTGRTPGVGPITVALHQRADNPSAARVARYLWESAHDDPDPERGHPTTLARFDAPPTVRLLSSATERERAMLRHAVGLINRHLPYAWHVKIGSDLPQAGGVPVTEQEIIDHLHDAVNRLPNGQIAVSFVGEPVPPSDRYAKGAAGLALLDFDHRYDQIQQRWERTGLRASGAWVARDQSSPEWKFRVVVHELLHALGLYAHPDADRFPKSVLAHTNETIESNLPDIDGTALRAAYTRLDNGAEPEDLSAESLGVWSTVSQNLIGTVPTRGGTVRFGVNYTNGFPVPWVEGPEPGTALASNRALAGTAAWDGKLYGAAQVDPSPRVIGGDARVTVNMGTLTGRADFTNLQTWSEAQARDGTAFGATPGVEWKTGQLGYTVSVNGNYLHSTGGDEGTVTGQFYGTAHQGVAGSVERTDLTAAFGARRQ